LTTDAEIQLYLVPKVNHVWKSS